MNPFSLKGHIAFVCLFFCFQLSAKTYETISPAQCDSLILDHFADPGFFIIDVRTQSEFQSGHLYNSINIDYRSADFAEQIAQLDTTATYLIHCQSGGRSASALTVFKEQGFDTVYEMKGGYRMWTGRSTTSDQNALFRYTDPEKASEQIAEGATPVNITNYKAFEQFNIPNSEYFSLDSMAVLDSLKTFDKDSKLLLYSSNREELDSIFQQLFVEGFHEVYYYNGTNEEWINKGFDYNTKTENPGGTVAIAEPIGNKVIIKQSRMSLKIICDFSKQAQIYSTNGTLLRTIMLEEGENRIDTEGMKGIFFIKTETGSVKIAL